MRIAVVAINRGLSANAVTALGHLALALGLAFVLLGGSSPGYFLLAAVMLHLVLVLDNVDGHVARYVGQTTVFGDFIDCLLAWLHYALLPLFLGVALYFGEPEPYLRRYGLAVSPVVWVVLGVVRSAACQLATTLGVKARLELAGRDYDERVSNRTALVLAKAVVDGEALLLVVAAATRTVSLLHTFYAGVYLAMLISAIAQNSRDMRSADRERGSGDEPASRGE